jgi:hypothetical protein
MSRALAYEKEERTRWLMDVPPDEEGIAAGEELRPYQKAG